MVPALATGTGGPSFFVQGGSGEERVRAVSAGMSWQLPWGDASGSITTHAELWVSEWRAPRVDGGHRALTQVGAVPLVRVRPDARSPWFLEGGIGVSLLDGDLHTPGRAFRTRWNFSDNLAFGRTFGPRGEHELSLRLQHTSNAGLRKPNPGLDLLMVRYSHRF